jgi:DNA excision repair protein ERCC-4
LLTSSQAFTEVKSHAKAGPKYLQKKSIGPSKVERQSLPLTIQHKLVLLSHSFPRVRIISPSSPFATAEIFNDLRLNNPAPDPSHANAIGAKEDHDAGAGVNAAAVAPRWSTTQVS